jgi:hypothetical protein
VRLSQTLDGALDALLRLRRQSDETRVVMREIREVRGRFRGLWIRGDQSRLRRVPCAHSSLCRARDERPGTGDSCD